jgi:DNA-directed RNA polymerase specialized sigma24 family protein
MSIEIAARKDYIMTNTTTLLPETASIIHNEPVSQPALSDRLANRGLPASEPFVTDNTANRAWDNFGGTGMTEEYEDGETIYRSDTEENDGASNDTGTSQSEEPCWQELYPSLQSLARYLVNTLPIPYWYGREADIADEIVQETMCRLLERIRKGQRGEAAPVKIVRHMMTTIAFNYYRDLKRHERRLTRLDQNAHNPNGEYEPINIHIINGITSQLDLDSIAEKVDQEALSHRWPHSSGNFPKNSARPCSSIWQTGCTSMKSTRLCKRPSIWSVSRCETTNGSSLPISENAPSISRCSVKHTNASSGSIPMISIEASIWIICL